MGNDRDGLADLDDRDGLASLENDCEDQAGLGNDRDGPAGLEDNRGDRTCDPGSLEDQQTHDGGPLGQQPHDPESDSEVNRFQHEEIILTDKAIQIIRSASLGDVHDGLSENARYYLQNPPQEPVLLDDPDLRLSIDVYMATENASEDTYHNVRQSILRRYPDSKILSLDKVKRRVTELSGVVPILQDMCYNSCLAFVGPWADLQHCSTCGEDRYNPIQPGQKKRTPRKQFHTFPIGPQLQTLFRTPEGADAMRYRERRTKEILEELRQTDGNISAYDDVFCGSDYLDNVLEGKIKDGNITLMLSIDGAQLYKNKASDAWIYIWVVLDHSPDRRYKKKHVLIGGIIGGPNPPKIIDSYLFPAFHHLAAIQNDGLKIWDAQCDTTFISRPFLLFGCADFIGLAPISGLVGHHGKNGCRIYCAMPGRHKDSKPHYYPARLKPDDYHIAGCDHDDVDINAIAGGSVEQYNRCLRSLRNSPNKTQYAR